ncbi:hypothetical protein ACO22_00773 [Paracoccidioides brasiliensis]|uniref:Uncharacterized protein n=1 Tax=Paracoccidioides brasiliensis TaxID=121759 RepID=A0A1D2JNB5_PARBR|nr:hypothetical protein ACO22_00773 [Paracoccidioides brasiliensis]
MASPHIPLPCIFPYASEESRDIATNDEAAGHQLDGVSQLELVSGNPVGVIGSTVPSWFRFPGMSWLRYDDLDPVDQSASSIQMLFGPLGPFAFQHLREET